MLLFGASHIIELQDLGAKLVGLVLARHDQGLVEFTHRRYWKIRRAELLFAGLLVHDHYSTAARIGKICIVQVD